MSDIITPDSFWRLGEIDIRLRLPIRIMQRLKKDADLRGVSIPEEVAYRVSRSFEDDDRDARARAVLKASHSIEQGE